MAHDHAHVHARPGAGDDRRRLTLALVVLGATMVVEVVAAIATNSLALFSDAGHMLTDVLGLAMALAAMHVAARGTDREHRTFGLYRLEILAALANAVLLTGVAAWVVIEAIRRFGDPPEVLAGPMLVVAVLGLAANLFAFALLRPSASSSMNLEGAYLEVMADTVGSVGVIIAAAIIATAGWEWVDPAVGVAIGVWILPRSVRLAGQAIRVLVQAAPPGTDLGQMSADLGAIDGVVDVHDLHVWTLTSQMEVASAHLMVRNGTDHHHVLDRARDVLRDSYGIDHATLQVEPEDHHGCAEVSW